MNTYPRIAGWNTSSEAGPDNFAPSIFLGGCNFRCPYCMNSTIVLDPAVTKTVDIQEIKKFVQENECKWINISGGEPTIHPFSPLKNLFLEIRSWGCNIAMSTNGSNSQALAMLLHNIDYITMDLKTGSINYWDVNPNYSGKFSPILDIFISLHLLRIKAGKDKDFNYELRTTMYPPLVGGKEMEEMALIVRPDEKWVLQPFRKARNMIDPMAHDVELYSEKKMDKLKKIAESACNNVSLRHV